MTLKQKIDKYLDGTAKLLDPRSRDIEPTEGDTSCVEMAVRKIDVEARTVEAAVSTPDVDRYQEIVEPKAYRKWLKHFKNNPVMLAAHDHSAWSTGEPTVIGRWTELKITDDGLLAKGEFMKDDELAEKYWARYRDQFMRAFSVGFIAHSWEMREFELAPGVNKRLRVFTEVELLEVSAVAVPANRQALARAASFLTHTSGGGKESDGSTEDNPARAFEEMLARLLKQELAREGGEIQKQLTEQLTDPDGPMARMLEELLQRAVDREGLDGYFAPGSEGDNKSGDSISGAGGGGQEQAEKEPDGVKAFFT